MVKPVLFLAYNRPGVTNLSFDCIRSVQPSRLYVAVDGPVSTASADQRETVEQVKKIVQRVDWPCEAQFLFRDENLGLRKGVNEAITWFFANEKDGIIIEDDIIAGPKFFEFCGKMLDQYADDQRVWMVSGANPMRHWHPTDQSHFFGEGGVWGWATWRDRWSRHDQAMSHWQEPESQRRAAGNLGPSWGRIRQDLTLVSQGQLNSWAYPWTYTRAAAGGLSVIPSCNLIENRGAGPAATHTINNSPLWRKPAYCDLPQDEDFDIKSDFRYATAVERRIRYQRWLRHSMPILDAWDEVRRVTNSTNFKIRRFTKKTSSEPSSMDSDVDGLDQRVRSAGRPPRNSSERGQ